MLMICRVSRLFILMDDLVDLDLELMIKLEDYKQDSIHVNNGRIVDFEDVFFDDFRTEYPLKKLRQEQINLSRKISLQDDFEEIETVAGIDVAYPDNEFDEACGACVVLDYNTMQVIEESVVFSPTDFPFISTYFSYRELPIVQKLMSHLRPTPSLLLLDGNGIIHPCSLWVCVSCGNHLGYSNDWGCKNPSLWYSERLSGDDR